MNQNLRHQVKALKAFYDISYTTIANEIGINRGSLYNWLNETYDFGYTTEQKLIRYINRIMGE